MGIKLTQTQREAVGDLRSIEPETWKGWGVGFGRYNVAMREFYYRHPELVEHKLDENGRDLWRLKGAVDGDGE